ncbi:Pr6Pr family membrane protein [Microbacterium proteolyticum]|uniref:Pr6Pr family membrane protein n=1 Tax=Microbacterium proteolyticum TaxID=1572644 RepID=UPI001FAB5F83|nr:Pr6Pr family membrane protein [Microbacterium proteolyticum]MCI9858289.1 Pr6Pr family membrane protein [Microbacterium proteolyticum]
MPPASVAVPEPPRSAGRTRPLVRVVVGSAALLVVFYAYVLRIAVGDTNPFDFFGYFTNQTSSLTALVLIAVGALALNGRRPPPWLSVAWGVGAACLIVVAVVYNALVPGTGSAPVWVSVALHVVFPALVLIDIAFSPDRPRLKWTQLWWVLPYPLVWITVVLLRGATDGWVPYGFLLPERGLPSLVLHVVGILTLLLVAATGVWALSRRTSRWSAAHTR